jgi:NAD(P)-dependent dehydrogenase (short-subunit alcohol dehydrogenase family)
MTRALALELGPDGIRLNCIAPGLVRTPMQEASASFLGSTAALDAVVDRAAIKRLADPDEIARPTLFLLSDMASYITGETLVVDGGVNIRYA